MPYAVLTTHLRSCSSLRDKNAALKRGKVGANLPYGPLDNTAPHWVWLDMELAALAGSQVA
ncbi:hypothetical protein GCM10028812_53870 [Ancylobacter sonchi]